MSESKHGHGVQKRSAKASLHEDAQEFANTQQNLLLNLLSFSIGSIWYGKLKVKDKGNLNKILRTAQKLGAKVISLDKLYNKNVLQRVKIIADEQHSLNDNFIFLRSSKRLTASATY